MINCYVLLNDFFIIEEEWLFCWLEGCCFDDYLGFFDLGL